MIGRFDITPPVIDDDMSQMVETHRAKTGQDYGAILLFGLWGTVDCSAEVRLYAGYQHLAANPEDGPSWLEVARAHLEAGEPDKAEAIIDELVNNDNPNLYPNMYSEDPEVHRAYIMADSGRLDQALDILDALRVKHGDSPVYHYAVATILQEKGDFAGAVASFNEALDALEDFRLEVVEEDMEEEMNVDFPAAADFLRAAAGEAERERPFEGERAMDLSGFQNVV